MAENDDTTTDETTEPTGSGRFAAYDKTYRRYVGGVHDTRKAAREAAKQRDVKTFEIREV